MIRKILLVNPHETSQLGFSNPPLGLLYLAGMLLKHGFDVQVIDGCLEGKEKVFKTLRLFKPDLVGITCLTPGRKKAIELAKMAKELTPEPMVVLGGVHPTIMYQQIMKNYSFVDGIVLGEGEETFLELALNRTLSKIQGLVYRENATIRKNPPRKLISNLDELPFPAWHLVDLKKYPARDQGIFRGIDLAREPRVSMIFSRGCSGHCSFCSTWWIWKGWRRRSPVNMAEEIQLLYEKHRIRHFCFADDSLTVDRAATIALCDEIIARGLNLVFHATTRTDCVDEEVLRKLREAGCYKIAFGIETGSQYLLDQMGKANQVEISRKAIQLAKKSGLLTTALVIVGNVGETEDTVRETIQFLRDTQPHEIGTVGGLWILPGTKLYADCKRKGFIDDDFWLTDEPYKVYTQELSQRELDTWQHWVMHYQQYGDKNKGPEENKPPHLGQRFLDKWHHYINPEVNEYSATTDWPDAHELHRELFNIIPSHCIKILDLGCGDGWSTHALIELGKKATGVTINPKEARHAVEKFGIQLAVQDMHDLSFPDYSFECIYCRESFEHCVAPYIALCEMNRVLIPGGYALINIPWEDWIREDSHYSVLTPAQMREMLYKCRFGVEKEGKSSSGHFYYLARKVADINQPNPLSPPKPGQPWILKTTLPPQQPAREPIRVIGMIRLKNEERWIREVLEKASSLVEGFVILDDGSTDGTPALVRNHPKVLRYEYQTEPVTDEARDKNKLLQWTLDFNPDWILCLDGDELLEDVAPWTIRREIALCPENVTKLGFGFLYFWDAPNRYRVDGIYSNLRHIRLFRIKGLEIHPRKLEFRSTEHGCNFHCGSVPYNLPGDALFIDVKVKHYGYFEKNQRCQKKEYYEAKDPEKARAGYYRHLTEETGMVLHPWQERSPGDILFSDSDARSVLEALRSAENPLWMSGLFFLPGYQSHLDLGSNNGITLRGLDSTKITCIENHPRAVEALNAQKLHVLMEEGSNIVPVLLEQRQYFDRITLFDFIETLEKKEGERLLDLLEKLAVRELLFMVPLESADLKGASTYQSLLAKFNKQDSLNGYPLKKQRSHWTAEEFRNRGYEVLGFNDFYLKGFNVFFAVKYLNTTDKELAINRINRSLNFLHSIYSKQPEDSKTANESVGLADYYLHNRNELLDFVPETALSVLDVGCAGGMLGKTLKKFKPERRLVGIEINSDAASLAARHLDSVFNEDAESFTPPFQSGEFDCILFADILEHLKDPWNTLINYSAYLKPGGTVIASIPNVRNLNILRNLAQFGSWKYADEGILDRTHLRFFTQKEFLDLLQKAHIRVDRITYLSGDHIAASPEGPNRILRYGDLILLNVSDEDLEELRAQQIVFVGTYRPGQHIRKNDQRAAEGMKVEDRYREIQNLIRLGRIDNALASLSALVEEAPDFALGYNDLGVLFLRKAKNEWAVANFEKAVQLEPANGTFLKNLANFYNLIDKRFEEALSLYQRVLLIKPNDPEALEGIALIAASLGKEREPGLSKINGPGLSSGMVSLVVPVFNKVDFTKKCVEAIQKHTDPGTYEIIIIDNGSTDGTRVYLETLRPAVRVLTNAVNLGFTRACNQGAKAARGEFVLFLNNDTEPQSGWLEALVEVLKADAAVGIAGSKLMYPDGRLQEAGGIIFRDGSGWNYGRFDDPELPRYNYVREVDYVSGAALLIRRTLLEDLGYFDERYSPGYYEDTDLCFQARAAGYKVVYCPFSKVIHHDGISSGTDLSQGMKKYQIINKEKFVNKWTPELVNQCFPDPHHVVLASQRKVRSNILIIDPFLPMFDRAAGSLRLFQIIELLRKGGHHVTFIARNGLGQEQYVQLLQKMGVEVYATDPQMMRRLGSPLTGREINIEEIVSARPYQWAMLSFYDIAIQYLPLIRRFSPETKILIDTVDIHFLREARLAALENDKNLQRKAGETQKAELDIYRQADTLITVTEKDWQAVKEFLPAMPHVVIPTIHAVVENTPSFAERQGLLFVGNFNHTPNGDAVRFFIREVWPLIKKRLPDLTLTVVGNNPPEDLRNSDLPGLKVTGYVPSTRPYLQNARVAVVPLRYGAGMKGKVGEALAHGLPVVSTSIGAEGMDLQHGENVLIADTPDAFAQGVEELYGRQDLWEKLSGRGRETVREQWSPERVRDILESTFAGPSGPVTGPAQPTGAGAAGPKAPTRRNAERPNSLCSIVIPAKDNWEYTRLCLDSLIRYAEIPYELILVDNGSAIPFQEPLKKWKRKNEGVALKYLRSNKNLGFAGGVNLGLQVSRGDFIVIFNNDTVVTPGLFPALLRPLTEGKEVGITGPVSNFVSGEQLIATRGLDFPDPRKVALDKIVRAAKKISRDFQGVTTPTNKLVGLCLALKRETVAAVGGFDERFFPGNFEDVDYSIRAVRKGFKLLICRDAFLYHFGNRTFRSEPGDYRTVLQDNLMAFMEKWGLQEFKSENELHEIPIARPRAAEENLYYPISRENHAYVFKPNGSGFIKKAVRAYWDSPFMWPSRLIIPSEGSDPGEMQQKIETWLEEKNLSDNGEIVIYSGRLEEILEGLEGARCLVSSWNSAAEARMRPDDVTLVL